MPSPAVAGDLGSPVTRSVLRQASALSCGRLSLRRAETSASRAGPRQSNHVNAPATAQAILGRMRFTEHELTAALTGTAKSVLASRRKVRRRGGDVDSAWEAMDRYERFKLLDALGGQVLPVLVALPDVEVTPGTRPSYSAGDPGQGHDPRRVGDPGRRPARRAATRPRCSTPSAPPTPASSSPAPPTRPGAIPARELVGGGRALGAVAEAVPDPVEAVAPGPGRRHRGRPGAGRRRPLRRRPRAGRPRESRLETTS